jgi:hypothetical protein
LFLIVQLLPKRIELLAGHFVFLSPRLPALLDSPHLIVGQFQLRLRVLVFGLPVIATLDEEPQQLLTRTNQSINVYLSGQLEYPPWIEEKQYHPMEQIHPITPTPIPNKHPAFLTAQGKP